MVTSFSETFGGIFRDVFGQWPPKPRIRRVPYGWVCQSAGDQLPGFGCTPEQAYRVWRVRNGQDQRQTMPRVGQ